MNLTMHLVFSGNCEEAFTVYKEVLKGEIAFMFRKKEDKSQILSAEEGEKISHMVLQSPDFFLAGEDAPAGETVVTGNNNKMTLKLNGLDEVRRAFDRLAEGGTVIMPLEKVFFSEAFGELTDKFGVRWLILMNDDGFEKE